MAGAATEAHRTTIVTIALWLVPTAALAGGDWMGLVDQSMELQTDTYAFTGNVPEQIQSNENYYDGDFADFDGDGRIDRVLGSRFGLLFNTGGGLMTPWAGYTGFLFRGMPGAPGWGEDAFQWVDADNDGDLDALSGGNNEPWVLQINERGRFRTEWQETGSIASVITMALTDVENDGDADLVLADGGFAQNFALWINDGTGHYTEEAAARGLPLAGNVIGGLVSGDVDGDGDYDLIIASSEDLSDTVEKVFYLATNDGTGNYTTTTFGLATPFTECCFVIEFAQGMNLGDIDDDGDLDFVVPFGPYGDKNTHPDVNAAVFENDGTGSFTDVSMDRFDIGSYPTGGLLLGKIAGENGKLVDLDYDDDLDFVIHSKPEGQLALLMNDGTGFFTLDEDHTMTFPPPGSGLGADTDITDIDGDGTYDVWVGVGGGSVHPMINTYAPDDGTRADVPREVQRVDASPGAVTVSWRAPAFASPARSYRVYRAPAPGLETRDRRLVKVVGQVHQDESFLDPITRHTTTEQLGDPDITLDGATDTITFVDTTVQDGVTYYYSVSHVGSENTVSWASDEVMAAVPGGAEDGSGPVIDIVAPVQEDWDAYPRIVVHWADGGSGVDPATAQISFDQDLGNPAVDGRAAGENLADLAYRADGGAVVLPLTPPLSLPSLTLATLTVEVADGDGNLGSAQAQVFVQQTAATLPSADAMVAPASGPAPLDVSFDGSGSTDGDGKIFRWEWYFGDGTTAIGRTVDHRFVAGGTYDVMLLVRDNDGGVDVTTASVEVEGPPPECELGQTQACYDGPDGTEGVGECAAGVQTCEELLWGECQGQVQPQDEICDDGLDNDCNGQVDDCGADSGDVLDDTGGEDDPGTGGSGEGSSAGSTGGDTAGMTGDGGGCSCRSGVGSTWGGGLLLMALGWRRRRERTAR